MKKLYIRAFLLFPLLLPHLLFFYLMRNRQLLLMDLKRYNNICRFNIRNELLSFILIFSCVKSFRNVFYYRLGIVRYLLMYLRPVESCHISTPNIGGGLFIEHGDAVHISAKRIGENCYVNQCVTIGFSNYTDSPVLLDNVSIKAGAKVIGKVLLGTNVIVGANAVVVKNIPDNCTVVGIPAYIVRKNGERVHLNL